VLDCHTATLAGRGGAAPPGGILNISTVAGNGMAGYSGDGGAATSAEMFSAYSVTVDASGNHEFMGLELR
jgi:hypothetical protein